MAAVREEAAAVPGEVPTGDRRPGGAVAWPRGRFGDLRHLRRDAVRPGGGWESQVMWFLMLALYDELRRLRAEGEHGQADTLLRDLAWTLGAELARLRPS